MSKQTPRAQILGKLIQEAREYAGRSPADCAAVLQISPEAYAAAERGEWPISLPDLEVLALYLGIPMGYFWGSEKLEEKRHVDYMNLVLLRHRLIGVTLRQQRLKEKRSVEDVAQVINVTPAEVEGYESGEKPVPYLHLEAMARYLKVTIGHFMDVERGPLGRHEAELRLVRIFNELSPEMQAFLANPQSVIYLETAYRLSKMDVTQLRQIAESILEITW